MEQTIAERALYWFIHGEVGSSSRAIAEYMLYGSCDGSFPHDSSDMGRCIKLLDAVPKWRGRMGEMGNVNEWWAAIAPQWQRLEAEFGFQPASAGAILRKLNNAVWESSNQQRVLIAKGISLEIRSAE